MSTIIVTSTLPADAQAHFITQPRTTQSKAVVSIRSRLSPQLSWLADTQAGAKGKARKELFNLFNNLVGGKKTVRTPQ